MTWRKRALVVNTWTVEATATDDEENAAENSMIKTAKPRDANISRFNSL